MLHEGRFIVHGIPETELTSTDSWEGVFSVYVAGENQGVPLFGEYGVEERSLVFRPRFPLRPGLAYLAVWRGSLQETFRLPPPPASARSRDAGGQ